MLLLSETTNTYKASFTVKHINTLICPFLFKFYNRAYENKETDNQILPHFHDCKDLNCEEREEERETDL